MATLQEHIDQSKADGTLKDEARGEVDRNLGGQKVVETQYVTDKPFLGSPLSFALLALTIIVVALIAWVTIKRLHKPKSLSDN